MKQHRWNLIIQQNPPGPDLTVGFPPSASHFSLERRQGKELGGWGGVKDHPDGKIRSSAFPEARQDKNPRPPGRALVEPQKGGFCPNSATVMGTTRSPEPAS